MADMAWYRQTVADLRENLGRAVAAQPSRRAPRPKHPLEVSIDKAKLAVDDRWRQRLADAIWRAAQLGPGEELTEEDALEMADAAAALHFHVGDFAAVVEAAREVLAEREERQAAQEAVDALTETAEEAEAEAAAIEREMEEACKPFRERISQAVRRATAIKRTHERLQAAHVVETYARNDWGVWLFPVAGMPVAPPTQRQGACNVSDPR